MKIKCREIVFIRQLLYVLLATVLQTQSAAAFASQQIPAVTHHFEVSRFTDQALSSQALSSGHSSLAMHWRAETLVQAAFAMKPTGSNVGALMIEVVRLTQAATQEMRDMIEPAIRHIITSGAADTEMAIVKGMVNFVYQQMRSQPGEFNASLENGVFFSKMKDQLNTVSVFTQHKAYFVDQHVKVFDVGVLRRLIQGENIPNYEALLWRDRTPADETFLQQAYDIMLDAVILAMHQALVDGCSLEEAKPKGSRAGRDAHERFNRDAYDNNQVPAAKPLSAENLLLFMKRTSQGLPVSPQEVMRNIDGLVDLILKPDQFRNFVRWFISQEWQGIPPLQKDMYRLRISHAILGCMAVRNVWDREIEESLDAMLESPSPTMVKIVLTGLASPEVPIPNYRLCPALIKVLKRNWNDMDEQGNVHLAVLAVAQSRRGWNNDIADVWRNLLTTRGGVMATDVVFKVGRAMGDMNGIPDDFIAGRIPEILAIELTDSDDTAVAEFKKEALGVIAGWAKRHPTAAILEACAKAVEKQTIVPAAALSADIVRAELMTVRQAMGRLKSFAAQVVDNPREMVLTFMEDKGVITIRCDDEGWSIEAVELTKDQQVIYVEWSAQSGMLRIVTRRPDLLLENRQERFIPATTGAFGDLSIATGSYGSIKDLVVSLAPWLRDELNKQQFKATARRLPLSLLGIRVELMESPEQQFKKRLPEIIAQLEKGRSYPPVAPRMPESMHDIDSVARAAHSMLAVALEKPSFRGDRSLATQTYETCVRMIHSSVGRLGLSRDQLLRLFCDAIALATGDEDAYSDVDTESFHALNRMLSPLRLSIGSGDSLPIPKAMAEQGQIGFEVNLRLAVAYAAIANAVGDLHEAAIAELLMPFGLSMSGESRGFSNDDLQKFLEELGPSAPQWAGDKTDTTLQLVIKIIMTLWAPQSLLDLFLNLGDWTMWFDNLKGSNSVMMLLDRRQDFAFLQLPVMVLLREGYNVTLVGSQGPALQQPTAGWLSQMLRESDWAVPYIESKHLHVISHGNAVPGLDLTNTTLGFNNAVMAHDVVMALGRYVGTLVGNSSFPRPVLSLAFFGKTVILAGNDASYEAFQLRQQMRLAA